MKEAGSFAEAGVGVAAVEGWRREGFARRQGVGEVEGVIAAGYADLLVGGLFDGDFPTAAPGQGSEPDVAALFAGLAVAVDGEPGVDLVTGAAAAAFQHLLAGADGSALELGLACPSSGEVAEAIAFAGREVPRRRLGALDDQRPGGGVADGGLAAEDPCFLVHFVGQGDVDVHLDVLELNFQGVGLDAVAHIVEDQVAVAVGEGDLEGGLGV